jgi:hypothetical protein
MIDVYWSNNFPGDPVDNFTMSLIQEKPVPLREELKKIFPIKEYFLCPATASFFKNLYVVKSPVSLEVDLKDHTHTFVDVIPREGCVTYELKNPLVFFSEHSMQMEQTPAYMHKNEFTLRTQVFSGSFDISKWFRNVMPDFMMYNTSNLKIERGDALYYVKFNCEETVNLKHFEYTKEIDDIQKSCLFCKHQIPNLGLKKMYSMFTKRKRDKVLLKHIKNNLTGY